ncbi:MAG: hypothetical protein JKX96_11225, partial [Acinetobacter sp.]|nr:hypothetical protein [Acinetobacter sp.]
MGEFKFDPMALGDPAEDIGIDDSPNESFTFNPDVLKPDLTAPIEDAMHVNPDDHAKNLRLSQETGLPTAAIEQDQKTIEHQVKTKEIHNTLGKHKFTATWMSEGDNARLAHDDIEGLTALEAISNAWSRGILRIQQGGSQFMAEESAEMFLDKSRSIGEIFLDQNQSSNPLGSLFAAPLAAERFVTSRLAGGADLSAKRSLE